MIDLDRLVDARTGILTAHARQPRDAGAPRFWRSHGASVAHTERFGPWRADGFGFGASFGDLAAARGAAIGEAIERYCGNAVPPGLPVASWRELAEGGQDALDPDALALYSAEQHAHPGFPFTPLDRDLRVAWTSGTDLATGAAVLVPASLAYLDYAAARPEEEPPTHSLMYSGIAAGADRISAEIGAIDELIERDATTVWWASGASTTELDDAGRTVGQLGDLGDGTTVRLLRIPTDLPGHVVAAVIEDGDPAGSGRLAFGSACRDTLAAAARKALMEALGLRRVTGQLLDPESEVWRALRDDAIDAHVFLPYRADRRYRDDVPADFRTLADLPPVAQLYLDPRMAAAILPRLRPDTSEQVAPAQIPPVEPSAALQWRVTALARLGIRTVSVDVTTPDVRACGAHVVRVIAAGLVGNGPPAFPLRGSPRYLDVPRRLGWDRTPASTSELYPLPIPLA